jgi:S-formylglutathione hydrolase FrmB
MSTHFVRFFSQALAGMGEFYMCLPEKDLPVFLKDNPYYQRGTKTLILLHGYNGGSSDWLYGSQMQDYAMKYNLAVVTPAGRNSFYLNKKATGHHFQTFIGEELVRFLQNTYGLAMNKEDTFIGGFSMGGYGAIRTALHHPEVFAGAIGLSSGLITDQFAAMKHGDKSVMITRLSYYEHLFGDLDKVKGSDKDPKWLAERALALGDGKPALYLACGTEDGAIWASRDFHAYLDQIGYEHTYEEGPGIHNFAFWDPYIARALDWMDEHKA